MNVDVHLIQITEDKLKNILLENQSRVATKNEWIAPLGLFISLLLAVLTTDAKPAFGLSSHAWQAIFLISCALSIIWLLVAIKNIKDGLTVDDLIKKIKNI
ncbi:hypothetical protein [Stutzerimonas nitrititolerans]|uniref:hypothetical protein n=1 Tax=Stutzerimonas nitrititolerans TaxID=2482751 RepID=UPI0028AA500A|nr:hypothetical protein [Stutzerimonas nitrititolerans]